MELWKLLLTSLVATQIETSAPTSGNAFRQLWPEKENQILGNGIVLNRDWIKSASGAEKLEGLPSVLPPPSFVQVFEFTGGDGSIPMRQHPPPDGNGCDKLHELGLAASQIIEENLSKTGAILFRGLPIKDVPEFKTFSHALGWRSIPYVPFGKSREQVDGIDLASSIPAENALSAHNEMVYNPPPEVKRIAFFCLQPAIAGGESTLIRNSELTDRLPLRMLDFLRENDGILYTRSYFDATGDAGVDFSKLRIASWQEKCGTTERTEAFQFFRNLGFSYDDISFDEEGNLTVNYRHSGFRKEGEKDVWYNIIESQMVRLPDGSPFPTSYIDELRRNVWLSTKAFKLQKGDWLVLDNHRVMHGRLPYSKEGPERVLLTLYDGSQPVSDVPLK